MSRPLTRNARRLLTTAYRDGALRDINLTGNQGTIAADMVARGFLTAGDSGLAITADGCRAIGKKPKEVDMSSLAMGQLDQMVRPAMAIVQASGYQATGDNATDRSAAITILLTICVAAGILARVVGIPAAKCLEAIQVGRKVKIEEPPEGATAAPDGTAL